MQQHWPKDEQVFSWDPENMDRYWELCEKYDAFPVLESDVSELESQRQYAQMQPDFLRRD